MRVPCALLIQRSETRPAASETHFAQAVQKVPPATERALTPAALMLRAPLPSWPLC